jgi:hypothetical protein
MNAYWVLTEDGRELERAYILLGTITAKYEKKKKKKVLSSVNIYAICLNCCISE